MKYLFIINPCAGKKNPYKAIVPEINRICEKYSIDYEVKETEYPRHATEIARDFATKNNRVRIFACGGDGTLCETANGLVGLDNAELGAIPCGSGNDYIKSFNEESFYDFERNIKGKSRKVDMIKCGDDFALNLCSMGIDAIMGYRAGKVKKIPLIPGKMAYNIAVLWTFLGNLDNRFKITVDENDPIEGNFMFALAACGEWYGGGYHAGKGALVDDGLLDFVMIKRVPKIRILSLLPSYKNGTYAENPHYKDIMFKFRGKKMKIECDRLAVLNRDGECIEVREIQFEVIPDALNFIIP